MKMFLMLFILSVVMISAGALAQGGTVPTTESAAQSQRYPEAVEKKSSAENTQRGTAGPIYNSGQPSSECNKCPLPKNYDSQEVLKQTKDIDHSSVIETQSEVPSTRVSETNHLVIHENETRNVGTIEHNHTIIEKERILTKRNVDHKYVNTVVNLVEHKYNTQRKKVVEEVELPGETRDLGECNCNDPAQNNGGGPAVIGR
jgi:hypothetical protein